VGLDKSEWKPLLLSREQYWIDYYKAKGPVYNIDPVAGSRLGSKQPESFARTLSEFHKGKPKSEEHKLNISKGRKGQKKSASSLAAHKAALDKFFEENPDRVSPRRNRAITNASGKRKPEAVEKFSENAKKQFAGEEGHAELVRRARLGGKKRRAFTPDQVRNIRALREAGHSFKEIAEMLGIPQGSIYAICNRRVYKDVI
jgi:hypothetical protein